MFEVVPEPEFSAWFEALPDLFAEEVASAIDLTASAGPALMPQRLSRLLLWYDGTGSGSRLELGGQLVELHETPAHRLRDYLSWHQEVVLCLESVTFRERLARLEPARATEALTLVELVKRRLRAARASTTYNPWRHGLQPTPQALPEWVAVRDAFSDLLSYLGLATHEVLGAGSGLRELSLHHMTPPLRVLFGLDFEGKRLLAILGETLERSYYGDSVARAEQRWRHYLQHRPVSTAPRAT
jgi:hypothetical protein